MKRKVTLKNSSLEEIIDELKNSADLIEKLIKIHIFVSKRTNREFALDYDQNLLDMRN